MREICTRHNEEICPICTRHNEEIASLCLVQIGDLPHTPGPKYLIVSSTDRRFVPWRRLRELRKPSLSHSSIYHHGCLKCPRAISSPLVWRRNTRNTLQQTAAHCNTLHHATTHCTLISSNLFFGEETHCNTLQHTATPSHGTYC